MSNEKRLPDAYYKGKNGNNYKLLNLNELAVEAFLKDLTDVVNCLDIMQSTGKTLDFFGETVGQKRGVLDDTQYRLMILNKIGRNVCQGDYNSVIGLLSQIFNCKKSDIVIVDSSEPCRVSIKKFPLEILINAGFSSMQAIKLIELLLPVCVKLLEANFEGTFEFGSIVEGSDYETMSSFIYQDFQAKTYKQMEEMVSQEYDENKGFGNIEQTIGGYFGLLLDDTNTFDLPI